MDSNPTRPPICAHLFQECWQTEMAGKLNEVSSRIQGLVEEARALSDKIVKEQEIKKLVYEHGLALPVEGLCL